ncbi:hypothetical protein ACQKMD_21310 [Viridibacillus sp. NPDC096237]|uniref:hypothetical protein n=1 Tax=Viridibacillus sp. NPDC096237 TaxID=3390721 RepID=UPI003D01F886
MSQNFDKEFNKLKNPPRDLQKQQVAYDELLQKIEKVDTRPSFWPRLQYPLVLIATCIVFLITVITISSNDNEKPFNGASVGLEGVSSQQIKSIYTLSLENDVTNSKKFYGKKSKAYFNVQKVTDTSYINSIYTHIQNNKTKQIDIEQLTAIADLIIVVKHQEIQLKIFDDNNQALYVQDWETKEFFQLNDRSILKDLMQIEEQNHEWRNIFIGLGVVLVLKYLIKIILIRAFNISFPKVRVKQSPMRIVVSIIISFVALGLLNFNESINVTPSYIFLGAIIMLISSIEIIFGWRKYKEYGVLGRNILPFFIIPLFLIIMIIVK